MRITRITPVDLGADTDEDDGARTEAWNSSTGTGKVFALAVCNRGSDVASVTYNRASQNLTSSVGAAQSTVTCPGGVAEETVGGGSGTAPNAFDSLTTMFPSPSEWSYGLRGNNPSSRTLTGVIVCLPIASRDVTIRTRMIQLDPGEAGTIRVNCPRGTRVTGGGGSPGDGFAILRSRPFDLGRDRDRAPDDGWFTRHRNLVSTPQVVRGNAICVGPVL